MGDGEDKIIIAYTVAAAMVTKDHENTENRMTLFRRNYCSRIYPPHLTFEMKKVITEGQNSVWTKK